MAEEQRGQVSVSQLSEISKTGRAQRSPYCVKNSLLKRDI